METKKKVILSAALLAAVVSAYAQGNGQAGITEATNMITSYFGVRHRCGLRTDWRGKGI